METAEMSYPAKIAARRKALGLNQQELGDLIGASKSQVSEWERGKHGLSIDHAIGIATALGCSLDYLLRDAVDPEGSAAPGITPAEMEVVRVIREWGPDGPSIFMRLLARLARPGLGEADDATASPATGAASRPASGRDREGSRSQ